MLTTGDIDKAREDERWLGYGYLGERDSANAKRRGQADRLIVNYANAQGWTYEDLFAWCNSKPGRWFGDTIFGTTEPVRARFEQAVAWNLLNKIEDDAQ